jgi:hypothetical protein
MLAGANFKDMYAKQEQTYWCWSACAQMVLERLEMRPVPRQCEIAHKRLGTDCCTTPAACNQPCSMSEVAGLYERLGVVCSGVEQPLSEEGLLEELFADRPVQIGYTYSDYPVGHVVVALGETNHPKRGGLKYILLADPAIGKNRMRIYEDVRTDGGRGVWAWTWIRMSKRGTS